MTAVAYAATVFFGMLAICFVLVVCMAGACWLFSLARQACKDVVAWVRKWIGYLGLLKDLRRWTRRYRYQPPERGRMREWIARRWARKFIDDIRDGKAGT